ncbi:hypothetical protein NUW58_g9593 [Xylaria curta]|uniref:Uncharacterized protein n=1 Tax=Xylaria curta TaxID=42375 RepID=A0ACC1MUX0_9PEZI|nr:hypothetical protein NUW58_g9593 [Xylaria curta]
MAKTIADSFALTNGEEPPKPKEKPNYGNSGTLAAASNSITQADGSTIVLKYHEPPEARKPSPKDQWKLFVFKGKDIVDTVPLSNRSCWLVGRDMAVVDMVAEHPSVSKQHAVIQFRYIEKRNEYGDKLGKVKPYLIDLESANGTALNLKKVPQSRYLELRDKDMIQFGQSTREYVLINVAMHRKHRDGPYAAVPAPDRVGAVFLVSVKSTTPPRLSSGRPERSSRPQLANLLIHYPIWLDKERGYRRLARIAARIALDAADCTDTEQIWPRSMWVQPNRIWQFPATDWAAFDQQE